MVYIKHVAGEFVDNKQMCVICGFEICNYEHAMFPAGESPPQGWHEGPLYVSQSKNPTIFCSQEPTGDTVIDCINA